MLLKKGASYLQNWMNQQQHKNQMMSARRMKKMTSNVLQLNADWVNTQQHDEADTKTVEKNKYHMNNNKYKYKLKTIK